MKHLLTAVLAAAALGLCAPTALAATPPQTAAESQAAEQWLADLAQWAAGYNTVMGQRAVTLQWLSDSTHQLIAKLDAGDKTAARNFAARVAEEGRRRLSAEMDSYQALPTEPPLFPLAHLIPPSQRSMLNTFTLMPDRFGAMMIRTDQAANDFIQHIVVAPSGRPEDVSALIAAYYGLAIARSEAAIAMAESMRTIPESPMYRLHGIFIESEQAMIAWTQFNRSVELGEPVDPAATAAAIRVHADAIHVQAGEMARRSNGDIVTIRATPSYASTGMGQIMLNAHASFVRSANIEHRTADLMDVVADAIEKAQNDPQQSERALSALADQYDVILNDRMVEDQTRRQLIAQNGG